MIRMSKELALAAKSPEEAVKRILLRKPTAAELSQYQQYASRHGLENLCRVLLNTNEFLFVD
jgi:hypothetical protein